MKHKVLVTDREPTRAMRLKFRLVKITWDMEAGVNRLHQIAIPVNNIRPNHPSPMLFDQKDQNADKPRPEDF